MTAILINSKKSFGGWHNQYQHHSKTLSCEMSFNLYLPKNENHQPISLIWWLTGLGGSDANFSTKAGFQYFADKYQVAVAIPDTSPRGEDVPNVEGYDLGQGASYYINATQALWQANFQMYDYITQELSDIIHGLVPYFDGNESIMGHSIGGYGALMIGLKNPQRFKAISAFAPATNITQAPWGIKAFTNYLGANQADWQAWDPIQLLVEANEVAPILITQGDADEFYPEQLDEKAFLKAAADNRRTVTYNSESGYDHSYYTIATFIGQHFAFHDNHLK